MILRLRQIVFFGIMLGAFFISHAESLEDAKNPQVTIHGYGPYVFATWAKNNGTNDIIQAAFSSDFGSSWSIPSPLSASGQTALNPKIVDCNRQVYIYNLWTRSNGTNDIIQFDASKNRFSSWLTPVNLSADGQDASNPEFATDDLGRYTYAIWSRSNGTNDIIQFTSSPYFGSNFSSPVDLSSIGQNASNPKVCTISSYGCVCAIWQRANVIQFSHSSDRGNTWDSVVDLSDAAQNAKTPDIISKDLAIHAIWVRSNGTNDIVQCRSSTDNASTWSNVIDVSASGQNAKDPKIVSDVSGRFAYIAWIRSNGENNIAQVSRTDDSGATWKTPKDLSLPDQNAKDVQITTDAYGQNIYVLWARSNGENDIIQLSYSNDYGKLWKTPIDLSASLQDAKNPQIITSFPGMNTFAIWARSDGTKNVIELATSAYYGASWTSSIIISN
ncbi:MAG: hypothetical protein K1060chlam1_00701 [Candidatus Anoxychlamydiales bacterium]|nr:hypothetical protein [Candidatus Anoxychlamydiales bacterium]